ncbi:hypothetical protein B0H10DRAFT_1958409 [Mycena sp. CBHHK59/15]|nr:hypothetical protein B0H10DRAFT_1958409 [Mycena sp. CBHHK59/15]
MDSSERELNALLVGEMLKVIVARIIVVAKIIVIAMVDQCRQVFKLVGGGVVGSRGGIRTKRGTVRHETDVERRKFSKEAWRTGGKLRLKRDSKDARRIQKGLGLQDIVLKRKYTGNDGRIDTIIISTATPLSVYKACNCSYDSSINPLPKTDFVVDPSKPPMCRNPSITLPSHASSATVSERNTAWM